MVLGYPPVIGIRAGRISFFGAVETAPNSKLKAQKRFHPHGSRSSNRPESEALWGAWGASVPTRAALQIGKPEKGNWNHG